MKFWEKAFEQVRKQAIKVGGDLYDRKSFQAGFEIGRAWITEESDLKLGELTAEELVAAKSGTRLRVMKMIRERLGCHLKEAKLILDAASPIGAKP